MSESQTNRLTGQCLCGGIRYEVAGRPLFSAICHCRHCQRAGGTAFSLVAGVPEAAFHQSGETRVYHDTSEGGRPVERHFCGTCGSPVLSRILPLPGVVLLKAGTIDDPGVIEPSVEVFCASRMRFLTPIPGAEQHVGSNV